MNVTEIEQGTDAWWDFIRAAKTAEESGRKLSISVTANGRGVPMVAFKVGEGMWTAHRPVTKMEWRRCPMCGAHANVIVGVGVCPVCDGE